MVLPYWRQLLRVICYLHAQGIVHRAIEPKNIYIDEKSKIYNI
jgi:serine/threonine protein kinase